MTFVIWLFDYFWSDQWFLFTIQFALYNTYRLKQCCCFFTYVFVIYTATERYYYLTALWQLCRIIVLSTFILPYSRLSQPRDQYPVCSPLIWKWYLKIPTNITEMKSNCHFEMEKLGTNHKQAHNNRLIFYPPEEWKVGFALGLLTNNMTHILYLNVGHKNLPTSIIWDHLSKGWQRIWLFGT